MTAPQLDDQSLAALLERRAGRAELSDGERDMLLGAVLATAAQPIPRWQLRSARALLPLATVLAVIVVMATAILGTAPLQLSGSSPSASPGASIPASPSSNRVLTLSELQAAVDASAFDRADRTVIADASIDRAAMLGRLGPLCLAGDTCSIGLLTGIHGPDAGDENGVLVQAGPDVRAVVSPSGDPLTGLLALTIHGRRTIELLGVVRVTPSGEFLWPATETAARGALEMDPAHAIAIRGWLARTNTHVAYDCYIRPGSPPPTDSPFEGCGASAWIASVATAGLRSAPFGSIKVQLGAYSTFAPDPVIESDGTVEPRLATYLLRVVVDPNCGPTECRGWRVVGRVSEPPPTAAEPSPSAGPSPTASPVATPSAVRALLYVELQQVISEARADGQERTVLADMQIDGKPSSFADRADCGPKGGCLVGTMPDLGGVVVPIYATSVLRDGWGGGTAGHGGEFVVVVRGDSTLDLLGSPRWTDSGSPLWIALASSLPKQPGDVLVDGWLTGTEFPCPPGPLENGDSPFFYCNDSWITVSPVSSDPNAIVDDGTFLALGGIPVQPSAYSTFAPDPVGGHRNAITTPRQGTYLITHATTTLGGCNPCDAWRVLGRMTEGGLPVAGFSPPPTVPPIPDAAILSIEQLRTAIADHRTGGAPTQDVVADISIDTTLRPEPIHRECQAQIGPCSVIGVLNGFTPDDGAVLLRDDDYYPALTLRDGRGPVALRLSTGPVQYLGHVGVASSGLTWSSVDAQAALDSVTPGDILAVEGWLESVQTASCGPAPMPGPPVLPPWGCAIKDAITPEPVQTTFPMGPNEFETVEPSTGLLVQMGAYREYAPDPVPSLPAVRYGIYLVERVQNLNSNCNDCQGWLVVGRLEPSSTGQTEANPRVWSPAELEALLAKDRASLAGRTVIVDGSIDPGAWLCRGGDRCPIGDLVGTAERAFATSADAAYLDPARTQDTTGHLALTVRGDGLDWLGPFAYASDNGPVFAVADLLTHRDFRSSPGTLFVVRAWLVDDRGAARSCPVRATPAPAGFDAGCQISWITADRTLAVGGPLEGAIEVQQDAYVQFAPDPALTPETSPSSEPRFGTYVLRLDSSQPGSGNFKVVARLDP